MRVTDTNQLHRKEFECSKSRGPPTIQAGGLLWFCFSIGMVAFASRVSIRVSADSFMQLRP
jgi:hypothetical protein